MKQLLASMAVLAAVGMTLPSVAYAEHEQNDNTAMSKSITVVNAERLQHMMKSEKDLVVVDSRGEKYMGDGSIIKGAKHLSADVTTPQNLAKLVPSKDTPVVFYCADVNCPASESAATKATELGYRRVFKYPGGIADWQEKKLPTEKL